MHSIIDNACESYFTIYIWNQKLNCSQPTKGGGLDRLLNIAKLSSNKSFFFISQVNIIKFYYMTV